MNAHPACQLYAQGAPVFCGTAIISEPGTLLLRKLALSHYAVPSNRAELSLKGQPEM